MLTLGIEKADIEFERMLDDVNNVLVTYGYPEDIREYVLEAIDNYQYVKDTLLKYERNE